MINSTMAPCKASSEAVRAVYIKALACKTKNILWRVVGGAFVREAETRGKDGGVGHLYLPCLLSFLLPVCGPPTSPILSAYVA